MLDKKHKVNEESVERQFRRVCTFDYVIDEAMTTAVARTRRHELAIDIGKYIIESPRITKLWTTKSIFENAWRRFKTLKDKPLSFTDCVTLAQTETNSIKQILSFDIGFDGLIRRIH